MSFPPPLQPAICMVALANLPYLAPEYGACSAGGAELQQVLLAKALVRRGFRVTTVVYDYGQPDGATWQGVTVYKTYRPDAGIRILRFFHPRWTSAWRALRRANADIYYLSCAGPLVGEVSMFARRHGRKLVYRVAHDTDCDPRTVMIRYWRDRALYGYGLRRADLVLAQTSSQHTLLGERFGVASRIAPSLLEPATSHRPFDERDIDVLWVANMRTWKRPDRLLDVAQQLPQLRFHMVGGSLPGEESSYESARQRAQSLHNVQFHGRLSPNDARLMFERARVLAGTSESEGFPNTYLHAWTHGTPVVSFIDPEHLITAHGLGRVVQTAVDMRTALQSLTRDAALWSEASVRCRAYADRRSDESNMLSPYLEAFAALHPAGPLSWNSLDAKRSLAQ